jgi:hypothetical protein
VLTRTARRRAALKTQIPEKHTAVIAAFVPSQQFVFGLRDDFHFLLKSLIWLRVPTVQCP